MITFTKIRWKNFLSTGNVFSEIDLSEAKTNLIVGTNGAGKSTVLDALTFSLFGKPFRKINKPMLVNSINEKDCVAEIEFNIGKNEYHVIRGIKPSRFEIYCNGQLWNQESTTIDQQKNFEQNVLKMNYKSFTQIVVLGSSTFVPFMKLPLASRREIIEDILDIQIFSVMNQNLKDKIRENSDSLTNFDYELKLLSNKIDLQQKYIQEIEKKNQEYIKQKQDKILEYKNTEKQGIEDLEILVKQTEELNKDLESYSNCSDRLKKLNTILIQLTSKIQNSQKQTMFFEDNHTCPTCTQTISSDIKKSKIEEGKEKISELSEGKQKLLSAINEQEDLLKKFDELTFQIKDTNSVITQTNYQLISIRKNISELEEEIKQLSTNISNKNKDYEVLENLSRDKKKIEHNLIDCKKEKDILSVASQLLKDNGIKTKIIRKYLPVMNQMINQYLQRMDFYVNFMLNENFEEVIKSRYRDEFCYESFSEGEKARIDIALLLTWRAIAKLKNSVDTNLLILDEIFDGSLDQNGTGELGWILRNFDDKTNVFVISHKESMNDKFDRTITFDKVKNFSVSTVTVSELS